MRDAKISQFEALTHTFRSGKSKVGIQPVQWVDVDSTVDKVYGRQEGSIDLISKNDNYIRKHTCY